MQFSLGCAVWAYKGWLGNLYPPGSRASDFLKLYSQHFSTVEGNTTFYVIPDRDTVARWRVDTPPGFKFCPKLPRDLTHRGLLEPAIPGALAFLERMQGLGDRLGPLFVQLPPRYGPDRLEDLTTFLAAWPDEAAPLALEVRHLAWFQPSHRSRLNTLLERLGVGRVLLDSRPIYECTDDPQRHSNRRKPELPLQPDLTAPFTLVRLISHPNPAENQRFLQEWGIRVEQWLKQGIRVYFFVHCPLEERSPPNAYALQTILEQQGLAIPPLPWQLSETPPTQLSLF